jgi:hypothetical protein
VGEEGRSSGRSIGELGHHPGLHVTVDVHGMTVGGVVCESEQLLPGVVVGLSALGDYVTIKLDAPIGNGSHQQELISIDDPSRIQPRELTDVHPDGVPDEIIQLVRAGKTKQAIKKYRALNGATLDEALAFIAKL